MSRPISMRRGRLELGTLISVTFAAVPGARELSGIAAGESGVASGISGGAACGRKGMSRVDRLDDDLFGQLRANAQANIADLTDDVGMLGEKADFLFFAEAHLAKAMSHLGSGIELLNLNGSACADVA